MEKFFEKGPKLCKKVKSCNKRQFTEFLLLNIVDQIFKISTIVETLVTVFAADIALWAAPSMRRWAKKCPLATHACLRMGLILWEGIRLP